MHRSAARLVAPAQSNEGVIFEKLRIKEHMEVVDQSGEHVGTVDKVEGEQIKLTKTDAADHSHHTIPLDELDGSKKIASTSR